MKLVSLFFAFALFICVYRAEEKPAGLDLALKNLSKADLPAVILNPQTAVSEELYVKSLNTVFCFKISWKIRTVCLNYKSLSFLD